MVLGGDEIVAVWTGRESKFPGASGTMVFQKNERWHEINDWSTARTMTDHPAAYAVLRPSTWVRKKTLDWGSIDGPALLGSGGRLYVAWAKRGGEHALRVTATSSGYLFDPSAGVPFDNPNKVYVPGVEKAARSKYSPAIAYFRGMYHVAWTAVKRGYIHTMRNTGLTRAHGWRDHVKFKGYKSVDAPALLATPDRLYMAWTDDKDRVLMRYTCDGANWSSMWRVARPGNSGIKSKSTPTLTLHNGRIYIAWAGYSNRYLHVMSSYNGTNWQSHKKITKARSRSAPHLISARVRDGLAGGFKTRLYLTWRGYSSKKVMWMASHDGVHWPSVKRVTEESSDVNPAMVFSHDRFIVGWTGRDSKNRLNLKVSTVFNDIAITP
jgi:hypothetical protein